MVAKPEKKFKIGIDLGGTNIKVGIINQQNQLLGHISTPTGVGRPYQKIIADMSKAISQLLQELKISISDCQSLGIGSPGIIDSKTGVILYSNNLYWDNVPVAKELQQFFDLPIHVSNDANCAALGEVLAGSAKGCTNAILLTLGTGIGGGVIVDGKIFEGGFAGATEIGHMVLSVDGVPCTCGRRGCFETYASATALIRETKEAANNHPESIILNLCNDDIDAIDGITPFAAAQQGDPAAMQVVENYIKYLSEGIVNLVNIFRPEKIIVSGGVCNQGDNLLAPVNQYVKRFCYAGEKGFIPPVVKASLGNHAGMIGAASLE